MATTYLLPTMSTISLSLSSPPLCLSSPLLLHAHPPMSLLRSLTLSLPLRHLRRNIRHLRRNNRRLFSALAAVRQDTTVWTPTPISVVEPAAESLFHVAIDLSDAPDLAVSHTRAGQYIQLRVPDSPKPTFLAIASRPSYGGATAGEFQFLVKSVAGSTAELLCGLRKGDVIDLGPVMGNGFDLDQISPPEDFPAVLIFATGSGISPIRSLIESGFSTKKRSDVRLYYGARNLQRMAYQDRFKDWESSGVKIVPVLSEPDEGWTGEAGYVQAAFLKCKSILSPKSTGAVLCGQKQMTEEITSLLTGHGVSSDKILKNF